jgi:hypothetical protein
VEVYRDQRGSGRGASVSRGKSRKFHAANKGCRGSEAAGSTVSSPCSWALLTPSPVYPTFVLRAQPILGANRRLWRTRTVATRFARVHAPTRAHSRTVRQSERQTDRQTDRQTRVSGVDSESVTCARETRISIPLVGRLLASLPSAPCFFPPRRPCPRLPRDRSTATDTPLDCRGLITAGESPAIEQLRGTSTRSVGHVSACLWTFCRNTSGPKDAGESGGRYSGSLEVTPAGRAEARFACGSTAGTKRGTREEQRHLRDDVPSRENKRRRPRT